MTDYAVKRLREGYTVSFGSHGWPHKIHATSDEGFLVETSYSHMYLPKEVVAVIAQYYNEEVADEG
jgi:hypothetical protein